MPRIVIVRFYHLKFYCECCGRCGLYVKVIRNKFSFTSVSCYIQMSWDFFWLVLYDVWLIPTSDLVSQFFKASRTDTCYTLCWAHGQFFTFKVIFIDSCGFSKVWDNSFCSAWPQYSYLPYKILQYINRLIIIIIIALILTSTREVPYQSGKLSSFAWSEVVVSPWQLNALVSQDGDRQRPGNIWAWRT
jgi:hypothetical protein